MSDAVSSVQSTQGAQQTQNVQPSQADASRANSSTPNASQVQAFNNNLSTEQSSAQNSLSKGSLGDQTPVNVGNYWTSTNGVPDLLISNEKGSKNLVDSVDGLREKFEEFKKSDDFPDGGTLDLVPTPWGGNESSSVLTAFYNYALNKYGGGAFPPGVVH